ncbi:MAG TPA: DUF1592 domain-containing protein, partial [Myxococcaceae bacterium]|nr:DUF1592 domain-containing protein [Myxococcaceae bacterium]
MSSGSDDPGYVEGEPTTPFKPAPLGLRSLLGWQYRNSIEDLLGEAAAAKVVVPDDTPLNGFDAIGASQLSLSTRSVETYEQSARAAAKAVFAKAEARDRVLGCTPKSATDEACWTTFIRGFGRLAWRRSLTEEEVASWVSVGKSAGSAYGGFNRAAELVLAGLLQSPNFLNQVETGEPDPADPDRLRLTGVELASRVSYFLNGTTPSEALIAAAEAGELDTAEGIRQHARALLESPRARQAVARLFDEVFDLRHLEDLTKLEPYAASPSLLAAMRQESQLLVEKTAFEDNSDFRTIFGADYTYVNKELADHYGLEGAPAEGFVRLPL